ncbi:amino acid adenylation domain-containing protein [Actinomadura sp. WMMB 499]|uniref:amino acid adenylation domain-containing protein n=1 Tax=Actinomadura sp. WMMB 499 TaxID=1219491 RepID=UPI0012457608|nr:amino acid adenylation domain-containing protein [Actinomadura sp. WMMB 499]QFG21349.1 amino acid adenylation domain-containing protein [Actinomadura sp. WMMB 499]
MRRLVAAPGALAIHDRINRTAVEYPDDRGVAALFERQAVRTPDATAVVHRERTLSYRELDLLADGLAARLHEAGVGRGDVVGVCCARSPELIAALLAVLKCGAAYLPFDPDWPDGRLRLVLGRARCGVVVTDRPPALRARLPEQRFVPADGAAGGAVSGAAPAVRADPDDIAYINFTSGSTGTPKGVPIRHRSIVRLVHAARYARLDEHARLLQLAPISFDAATFEIWGALLNGGTCVLYPSAFLRFSELRKVLEAQRVTVVWLTAALFNTIVDEAPATLASVGTILTGGEAHSLRHIAAALRHYGPDRIVNAYGPTESTTFATYHPVRALDPDGSPLPIGTPIQNTRLYLVDGDRLCGAGETGEVWLAGPGLSPGYLANPAATRERFVERDIGGRRERLYRTGDRGRFRPDGAVVFLGRLDDQVKINGHRIEPGEVVHHLNRHPHVRQSHVVVGATAAGERTLVAFVVPEHEACTAASVREHLRAELPKYLIPSVIHFCAALPLSANGKVDRRALLTLHERATGAPVTAPDRPHPNPDETD